MFEYLDELDSTPLLNMSGYVSSEAADDEGGAGAGNWLEKDVGRAER